MAYRYLISRIDLAKSTHSAELTNNSEIAAAAAFQSGCAVYDLESGMQVTIPDSRHPYSVVCTPIPVVSY